MSLKRLAECFLFSVCLLGIGFSQSGSEIGREVAIPRHLSDGEEFVVSLQELISHGKRLFEAVWTGQEGGGRPFTKGTGAPLSEPTDPLGFPRSFNRVSAPVANACAGCHNAPFGIAGGGGDIVANVFVLGQRFDFATFDPLSDPPGIATKGALDESGKPVTLQSIANSRATLGMFGSGHIEMLARQITEDLQATRDSLRPGQSKPLRSKGISFGTLTRNGDSSWDTSKVEGLPAPSLQTTGPSDPPNLIVRPFHQAGAVVSIRQFTNNAFNHHHGIQPTERFGTDTDVDGDGFMNELTRADVTASVIHQATLSVPGRRIPSDPIIERAVKDGEQLFSSTGCTSCHIPSLPLDNPGWIFTEPNPFNPPGNLQVGEAPSLAVDLTDPSLPGPRLTVKPGGVVHVPAFTDLKLHDMGAPNQEPLDMNAPAGSAQFFAGNRKFITRKLWGIANEPPFGPHGKFTTLREAILAHSGEAEDSRSRFEKLSKPQKGAVIEFLKTLQVLPPGTKSLIVDENGNPRDWPPK